MTLGIMQPYFFPYIGYFQLINSVDLFVVYDDVNFIKQGWINRNRILLNGEARYLTVGLSGASSFKKINEISVRVDSRKILKTVEQAYRKAPYFRVVYPLIEGVIGQENENLAEFVTCSISTVMMYLGIEKKCVISSKEKIRTDLKGADRVIAICRHYGAGRYHNSIGGTDLYDKDTFHFAGVEISFVKPKEIVYGQFGNGFVADLSILDVMMFNSKEEIHDMLNQYDLV